jgi:hypothetical protein
MESNGQPHAPVALTLGKNASTSTVGGWVGPISGLHFWRKEKCLGPTSILSVA